MEDVSGGSMTDDHFEGNVIMEKRPFPSLLRDVLKGNVNMEKKPSPFWSPDDIKDRLASFWNIWEELIKHEELRNLRKWINHEELSFERRFEKTRRSIEYAKHMDKEKANDLITELQKCQDNFALMTEMKELKTSGAVAFKMAFWIAHDLGVLVSKCLKIQAGVIMILLVLLLLHLCSKGKQTCKLYPERGKITCIEVYLLGNEGAHAYNGNGIPFSRQTNPVEHVSLITDAENYRQENFQILPPIPTPHVILQKPTDKMIAVIAMNIGSEYVPLALQLGLSRSELDHIEEDHRTAVQRRVAILLRWREKEEKATIKKLADAFIKLGIDPDKVYASLEEA